MAGSPAIIDSMDFSSFQEEEDINPYMCKLVNAIIQFVRVRAGTGKVANLRAQSTSRHPQDQEQDSGSMDGHSGMNYRPTLALNSACPIPANVSSPATVSPTPQHTKLDPVLLPSITSSTDIADCDASNTARSGYDDSLESFNEVTCLHDFVRMFIVVKFKDDPYNCDGRYFEDGRYSDKDARYDRGQIAEYAGEVFERQHQLFLYSLYIYRDMFRVHLWDRNDGLRARADEVLYFFYYLVKRIDEQVGHDPTVQVLETESDVVSEMKAKIHYKTFNDYPRHVQELVKEALKVILKPWASYVHRRNQSMSMFRPCLSRVHTIST
ncbi:hypothetical protein K474DRAFT_1077907 [Panus rudis PR-1116 ss-1]|nr:hypothetical protein K474DRAFT_1077907 [Panus rudis PR-1116 ss-1]